MLLHPETQLKNVYRDIKNAASINRMVPVFYYRYVSHRKQLGTLVEASDTDNTQSKQPEDGGRFLGCSGTPGSSHT